MYQKRPFLRNERGDVLSPYIKLIDLYTALIIDPVRTFMHIVIASSIMTRLTAHGAIYNDT